MFEDLSPVILFRMSERLLLTGLVIVVALVVLIGFWKTVQRVTIKDGGAVGLAGSMALSTPVFALLSIILYAWVSLSHPIAFTPGPTEKRSDTTDIAAAESQGGGQFTGAVNPQSHTQAPTEVSSYARQRIRHQIWTLNCLADSTTVRPPAQSDLAEIKLQLMQGVWDSEWGNLPQFESWVRNPNSGVEPSPQVLEFYEGKHTGC